MIRVLLADDEALVRQGIRLVLETADDITVVAELEDGSSVLPATMEYRPDIVILDIHMPYVDGITAARQLSSLQRRPRVLILTAYTLDEDLHGALNAGADGFVLKDIAPLELIAAVRTIASGDALIAPGMTRRLIDRYTASSVVRATEAGLKLRILTPEQRYLLALVAHGWTNAEIAAELGLSESRVKAHVSELLRVLRLRNRVQAATLACTVGILDVPLREGRDHSGCNAASGDGAN